MWWSQFSYVCVIIHQCASLSRLRQSFTAALPINFWSNADQISSSASFKSKIMFFVLTVAYNKNPALPRKRDNPLKSGESGGGGLTISLVTKSTSLSPMWRLLCESEHRPAGRWNQLFHQFWQHVFRCSMCKWTNGLLTFRWIISRWEKSRSAERPIVESQTNWRDRL